MPVTIKQNKKPHELEVLYFKDDPLVVDMEKSKINFDEFQAQITNSLDRATLR